MHNTQPLSNGAAISTHKQNTQYAIHAQYRMGRREEKKIKSDYYGTQSVCFYIVQLLFENCKYEEGKMVVALRAAAVMADIKS